MVNIIVNRLLALFLIFFSASLAQIGLDFKNEINLERESNVLVNVYALNNSDVILSVYDADIIQVSQNYRNYLQNYSEQEISKYFYFSKNNLRIVGSEKINKESLWLLSSLPDNLEPGYRIIFISAQIIPETTVQAQYSVNIIPVIERPLIVYLPGIAIRKLEILDLEVVYEEVPKISFIVKNSGTVTTSFNYYLNIGNNTYRGFYSKLKPQEVSIIKVPVNVYGNFTVNLFLDYFSGNHSLEKNVIIEKRAKEILSLEENWVNIILILLLVVFSVLIYKRIKS